MKQSSFDATISALDAETSSLDVETSSLDAETSALGVATSAIARSYRWYRRGVSGDIGDCAVGITPQMCNRVTNHGDMSTFSKPALRAIVHWYYKHKTFMYSLKKEIPLLNKITNPWILISTRYTSSTCFKKNIPVLTDIVYLRLGINNILCYILLPHVWKLDTLPLWNLTSKNRVTPVSIQDGV